MDNVETVRDAIFGEKYADLYRIARSKISRFVRSADLEDALQNTFLKAWKHADTYDLSRGTEIESLSRWIVRIAVREAYKTGSRGAEHRQERRKDDFINEIPSTQEGPMELLEFKQDLEKTEGFFERMLSRSKEIIALKHGGMSCGEIAEIYETSEKNVSRIYRQAISDLRRHWKELKQAS